MKVLLVIFLGGGLGSISRYGISQWLGISQKGFPTGTLIANLLACILVGIIWGILSKRTNIDDGLKYGAIVGFCGGFSTFSTFSFETLGLISEQKPILAGIYVSASVILCLAGIMIGHIIGKAVA